jgi:hypothetical protein
MPPKYRPRICSGDIIAYISGSDASRVEKTYRYSGVDFTIPCAMVPFRGRC